MDALVVWDVAALALVLYGIVVGAARGFAAHLTRLIPVVVAYVLICGWNPAWSRVVDFLAAEDAAPPELRRLRVTVEVVAFVFLWLVAALARRRLAGPADDDRRGRGRLAGTLLGAATGAVVAVLFYGAVLGGGLVTEEERHDSKVAEPWAGAVLERAEDWPRRVRPSFLNSPPQDPSRHFDDEEDEPPTDE